MFIFAVLIQLMMGLSLLTFGMIRVAPCSAGISKLITFLNITCIVAVLFDLRTILDVVPRYEFNGSLWLDGTSISIPFGFEGDRVALFGMLMVLIVSTCVQAYTHYYMKTDPGLTRFYSYLQFFTFFMLFMLCSRNLIQFFCGWEGIGFCSYLLINFWGTRSEANRAALKAVFINRVGDASLFIGIILVYIAFGSSDFTFFNILVPELAPKCPVILVLGDTRLTIVDITCFFLIIAMMCKSAQIGFHMWLPDAMEGPTPVSALIHAATMVTAGIFLIIRCSALFEFSPISLQILVVVGTLTALFGSTTALCQFDIKKIIAYSTCSQLGYMVLACGLSNYNIAFYHLINHAFFKALLFLCAGVIIHSLGGEQDIRRMGGLRNKLFMIYCFMLVASMSLSGIFYMSGFYSKEAIVFLSQAVDPNSLFSPNVIFIILLASGVCTSLYSAKLIYYVFYTKPRGSLSVYKRKFVMPDSMTIAGMYFLAVLSITSGFLLKEFFLCNSDFFSSNIYVNPNYTSVLDAEFTLPVYGKLLPILSSFVGLAYYWRKKRKAPWWCYKPKAVIFANDNMYYDNYLNACKGDNTKFGKMPFFYIIYQRAIRKFIYKLKSARYSTCLDVTNGSYVYRPILPIVARYFTKVLYAEYKTYMFRWNFVIWLIRKIKHFNYLVWLFCSNAWYFDYLCVMVINFVCWMAEKTYYVVDKHIIYFFGPMGIEYLWGYISKLVIKAHNGRIDTYVGITLVNILIFMLVVLKFGGVF